MSTSSPRPTSTAVGAGGAAPPRAVLARVGPPVAAILFTIAVWWLITSVFAPGNRLLSSFAPQRALPAIVDLLQRGVLLHDIGSSLWRLLVGLLIAAVIGVPLGLAVGSLPSLWRTRADRSSSSCG